MNGRRKIRDSFVLLEEDQREVPLGDEDSGGLLSPPARPGGKKSTITPSPLSPIGEAEETSTFSPSSSLTPTKPGKSSDVQLKEEKYKRAIADTPNDANALSKYGV